MVENEALKYVAAIVGSFEYSSSMTPIHLTEGHWYYIIFALLFVAMNGFFVAAEFALVKIRSTRLEVLVNAGNPIARLAQKMVDQLDPYLSATQFGITLASLGLGWIGEPAFARLLTPFITDLGFSESTIHSLSFTMAFVTISALHIILGELVPKSIAIQMAERICLIVAIPMRIFFVIFYPFLWVLNTVSNLVLRVIGMKSITDAERAHTEEELKLILEDSFEEGTIGPRKWVLLDRAMDFSHKTLNDVMIPREAIVIFTLDKSLSDNIEMAKESGHTRFPLFDKKEGRLLGFVHMKDIIWNLEHNEVINLFDLSRPLLFFKATTTLDNALKEFQRKKIHMAIVQGEAGVILGLVTLEDVIEELVGDIDDEFDAME